MRFWLKILAFFEGDKIASAVALSILLLTVLSAAVGMALKNAGLYAALSVLFISAGAGFFLMRGIDGRRLSFLFSVEGVLFGALYALLYVSFIISQKIIERKLKRKEDKRRLQFTLPDRENEYLRDRLRVALDKDSEETFSEKWKMGAKLGYARKMLAKIKEASLSPVERIDVEEMARLVALYERKGKWSATDVKAVSEIFSRLLKLSAKYDIAV